MNDQLKYSTDNNGETYLRLKIGNQIYTLSGYSRAGLKTSILIDELNVGLDMGYASEKSFSFDNKLISHGHCDHIGALHTDYCARTFFNIDKEKLFVMPKQCIKPFILMSSAISEMNSGKSGDNIKIFDKLLLTKIVESENCEYEYIPLLETKDCVIKSFVMDHKIKSYGYIIYRKSKKLKTEYLELSSKEIVQLKNTIGADNLTEITYTPLVGYTGDTTINGVLQYEEFKMVPLLIMECTGFHQDEIKPCITGCHIHWNDIEQNIKHFNNQKIVLFHFSQKYKIIQDILDITDCSPIDKEDKNKIIFFF